MKDFKGPDKHNAFLGLSFSCTKSQLSYELFGLFVTESGL